MIILFGAILSIFYIERKKKECRDCCTGAKLQVVDYTEAREGLLSGAD